MSLPSQHRPSSTESPGSLRSQDIPGKRRRKVGVCSFYDPSTNCSMLQSRTKEPTLQLSRVTSKVESNKTEHIAHNIMMIDDQISNSLPGILRKNLFRRLSHYTLIHSKDEPEQKTTIGWEKSQDTWPRYERPRSFSLPTLAGKTLLSNASSSIKTFKLRKLSSQESIVKITITADKKMSSSSSRVDGIRRSVISLLSKNIDVRPVKLLGGRRLRKNFFGRRRNAICAELDSDIPLITAKMKFERIKSNTKNPFSYLRKWLCI